MSGKKGRSGRKKKNAGITGQNQQIIKSPAPVKTEPSLGAAGVADAFSKIENKIREIKPQSTPQAAGEPGAVSAMPPEVRRRAPENIIRLAWSKFYDFEDWWARKKLNMPEKYRGFFVDKALIEAHVAPTVQVVEKYVPDHVLTQLDEKAPLIALVAAFAEGQMAFFSKLKIAQEEIGQITRENKSTSQPQDTGYPKKGEV